MIITIIVLNHSFSFFQVSLRKNANLFFNFTAFYLLDFKLQITKTKKSLKLSVLYDDFTIICFVFTGFTEKEREFSQNAILRQQQATQSGFLRDFKLRQFHDLFYFSGFTEEEREFS